MINDEWYLWGHMLRVIQDQTVTPLIPKQKNASVLHEVVQEWGQVFEVHSKKIIPVTSMFHLKNEYVGVQMEKCILKSQQLIYV